MTAQEWLAFAAEWTKILGMHRLESDVEMVASWAPMFASYEADEVRAAMAKVLENPPAWRANVYDALMLELGKARMRQRASQVQTDDSRPTFPKCQMCRGVGMIEVPHRAKVSQENGWGPPWYTELVSCVCKLAEWMKANKRILPGLVTILEYEERLNPWGWLEQMAERNRVIMARLSHRERAKALDRTHGKLAIDAAMKRIAEKNK